MKKILFAFFFSLLTSHFSLSFGQANTYWHDRIDTTLFATADTTGHGANTYYATNTNTNFDISRLMNGTTVNLFFKKGNTGSSTLTLVTRTGTLAKKTIRKSGGSVLSSGDIPDSTALILDYYNGNFRVVGILTSIPANTYWQTTGNSGTTAGTNFIGTTDNKDFIFKRNGIISGGVDSSLFNTALGYNTNDLTKGNRNTGIGFYALRSETSGSYNTAVGVGNLEFDTSGIYNTALGVHALHNNTSGFSNTATGNDAMLNCLTGNENTADGKQALNGLTSGYGNTAQGAASLFLLTSGFRNQALGQQAGLNNNGSYNLFLGYQAGYYCSQSQHFHVGFQAYGNETDEENYDPIWGTFFYADPTQQKVILNAKVGIGTKTPSATLEVNGGITLTNKGINSSAGTSATINSQAGRFRLSSGNATFTLTNSYITANSIIVCTYASDPGTLTHYAIYVVAGNGSATINLKNNASVDTDINFIIIN